MTPQLPFMEYSEKQLQIIDAAQRLFAEGGFEGTSVRDIAKEADVNVAMISYYFGSKEKLLEAIVERHSSEIRTRLENLLLNTDMGPLAKIECLIDAYLDKYFIQQDFHKIVAREQMMQKNTALAHQLHEMKKKNQELVKKIIADGQKQGVFKRSIDIPLMMATMVGTTNQLVTTRHFYKDINNLQDMPDSDLLKHLKKKLSIHLKSIFKAILTYEN